jgi:putative transcriptional regulator
MRVRNKLREIRLGTHLTQETLAVLVGVTRQTIIAIEKEKFVPSVKLALQLSAVLRVPVTSIFQLEDEQGEK